MKWSWRWVLVPALVALVVVLDRPRAHRAVHRAEWLDAGGVPLRSVRAGKGDTTLVLIHGFGESLFGWRAVLDPLATRYRVVAFDLPGFGGSGKPDGPYDLPTTVKRLSDYLDRWTAGPLVVVGHSMGGELAAALGLARPDRVVSLVLIAPAGWNVGLGGIADTMNPGKARAIGWYLSSRAFVLPEHDSDWLGEPKAAADYTLMTDSAYRQAAAQVLEQFDFRGLRSEWSKITQPVLLIWGTWDPVIPFAVADSIAGLIPCRRQVTLEQALHRPHVEVPDTVTMEILAFVRHPECSRPPAPAAADTAH